MRNHLFFVTCFSLTLVAASLKAQPTGEDRVFQPAAMQQDFNYVRKALEETHPGLYMHHTKTEMQLIMDSLYRQLDKPLHFFDFYKVIDRLLAEVKCEHTYCTPYDDFNRQLVKWKLIPLQMYFSNNKAYVVVNRTADTGIHLGDEVLAINHYPIDSIKHVLYNYLMADGNMQVSKDKMLSSMAFNVYYYLFIERPETFDITVKNAEGIVAQKHFDTALRIPENNVLAMANPANKKILELDAAQKAANKAPYRLKMMKDSNMAVLTITDFTGERKKIFKLYNTFFTTLKEQKIGNLIVDLSNNGGGDEEYAAELLSYFIKDTARLVQAEYLVIGKDNDYLKISNLPKDIFKEWDNYIEPEREGRFYVKAQPKYSAELRQFYPKPNRFDGKVFFYVNGGTLSAASNCAGVAKSKKLAVITGEETGGCFVGGGTTNTLDITLPNSKIAAHTSIVYIKFATEGGDKDRGVIPDYPFVPDFNKMVNGDGNKQWLAFMYNLTQQKN